jgi:hypothetical protein
MQLIKRGLWVAVALVLATTPAARTQTSNGHYACTPLTGSFTNPCTGEVIVITEGQICISTDASVDGSGGLHFSFQFRSDFTAVGMTTGATYSEHDSSNFPENVNGNNPQFEFTFTQSYHVNTSGPDNNLYIQETVHVTANALGQITAMTATFNTGCK